MNLELLDVAVGYDPAKPILQHIRLSLQAGELCCILGPNGVGKTTLFKTILGLLPPLQGRVCIDSADIAKWKPRQRAALLAYVAQAHTPSYPYRVEEIALMGRMGQMGLLGQPTARDYTIAMEALEAVGLLPLVGQRYTEISGGERQLLLIARALAQQPRFLIMDEPTANLDYGNMVRVMQCIRHLASQGISVIFTSHAPDQAFMTQAKVLLVQRGAPAIFGTASQVITQRNLYEAYRTDIQILNVLDADGKPLQVVAPRFRD